MLRPLCRRPESPAVCSNTRETTSIARPGEGWSGRIQRRDVYGVCTIHAPALVGGSMRFISTSTLGVSSPHGTNDSKIWSRTWSTIDWTGHTQGEVESMQHVSSIYKESYQEVCGCLAWCCGCSCPSCSFSTCVYRLPWSPRSLVTIGTERLFYALRTTVPTSTTHTLEE